MTADGSYILLYNQLLLVVEIGGFVDHLGRQKSIKSIVSVGLFYSTSTLPFKHFSARIVSIPKSSVWAALAVDLMCAIDFYDDLRSILYVRLFL